MKRIMMMMLALMALAQGARAQSAAAQQITNTGVAVGNELLYATEHDSINRDKLVIIGAATMRWQLKMAEQSSRESVLYDRNSPTYHEMVFHCNKLVEEMDLFRAEADSCERDLTDVRQNADALLEEAREITLEAVVTGMSNNVPNPWKVNYERLKEGKDETPIYALDPDRESWRDDGDNMLLPDERLLIVDNALRQVKYIRKALGILRMKITIDFDIRTRMERAPSLPVVTSPASNRALERWGQRISAMAK